MKKALMTGIIRQDSYSQISKIPEFDPGKTRISVGSPIYGEEEVNAVIRCLLEKRLSQGKYVEQFEGMFADYVGMRHAVAVNSGSSANLLALNAFIENGDVKKGEEVIIPAATFATVASPIIQLGLVPVFVDVDEHSYNIDPLEAEKAISNKTKVIMPVHSMGNPADIVSIISLAKKRGLKVLEDCCESHGAEVNSKKVGSFGDISTLSFFVAHNITTGEGGMVFTNSEKYEEILRSLREFGRIKQSKGDKERFVHYDDILGDYDMRYIFTRLGFNVRMTDITASFGIEQLKKLESFNQTRIDNARFFMQKLKEYENLVQLPTVKENTKHTFYGFPIVVKKDAGFNRKDIVNYLEENLIETRPFFGGCLPDQPGFRHSQIRVVGNLAQSRNLKNNAFFIGCHPLIGKEERGYIVEVFRKFLDKYK